MYQPKISDENIHRLYLLKLKRQSPMTKLLDEILNNYFNSMPENIETEEPKKTLKKLYSYRDNPLLLTQ